MPTEASAYRSLSRLSVGAHLRAAAGFPIDPGQALTSHRHEYARRLPESYRSGDELADQASMPMRP
jgi:hypothetical protein